jgi:hypothetical protein
MDEEEGAGTGETEEAEEDAATMFGDRRQLQRQPQDVAKTADGPLQPW